MGNRKPCYFILVSPKLTASLRAPRFSVLSLCSPPLSDLGNSLRFPSGCFLTSTMTGHRGTSSDPQHHVCCIQAGKRSHLVWYGCICTASAPKLANFPSGCGAAGVEAAWGWAHTSGWPWELELCPSSRTARLLRALAQHPRCERKRKGQLTSGAGTSPNPPTHA